MRWFLALLAACSGGDGHHGKGEDSGLSSGLVWVDANGDVVDGVVYLGAQLSYVDGDGFVWMLDPLDPPADAIQPDRAVQVVYADAACSDPWASGVAAPRVVFADGEDLYAAADDANPGTVDPAYSGDACGQAFAAFGAVRWADLVEVAAPSVSWAPPLHPEER